MIVVKYLVSSSEILDFRNQAMPAILVTSLYEASTHPAENNLFVCSFLLIVRCENGWDIRLKDALECWTPAFSFFIRMAGIACHN